MICCQVKRAIKPSDPMFKQQWFLNHGAKVSRNLFKWEIYHEHDHHDHDHGHHDHDHSHHDHDHDQHNDPS